MTQPTTYLTKEGLAKLQEELQYTRTARRQEVADRIQIASRSGTVDNAEYDEAKKEQAFIEGRILDLERIINKSTIIEDVAEDSDVVNVGSKVTVLHQAARKKMNYFIVGSPEADPSQGKISNLSPIGKALIGTKVGQIAQVQAPAGVINLEILEIQ